MSSRVEKLVESGAWTLLSSSTEKLTVVWFAVRFPTKPISYLLTDVPLKSIIAGIGSQHKYVKRSISTISANAAFIESYDDLLPNDGQMTVKRPSNDRQKTIHTKGEREGERESPPHTPSIEREGEREENVCADGTPPHTHDSSNDDSKGKKRKKQQPPAKEREAPVVLREPKAFNRFYRLYPKKSKMRQEKEKLKRLWHQCELDGWSGDVIVQALETAIRSERWTEKEGLYKPNAFKFLEEELMRDFLPIGYAPTPLVDASEENAEAEAHPGMIYKLGVWWTPEELQAYADSMIIPERLKGKVQI